MKNTLRTAAFFVAIALFAFIAYYAYDNFRERTTMEKLAAIIHDEDARDMSGRMREYVADTSNTVRERAAVAIGRIGAAGAGQILFGMLSDPSHDVAASAAFALGLTKESEYAARLLDLAFDLPAGVGSWAVLSAGRLADSSMTEVIETLPSFLGHPSPEVREAACMAIFQSGAKTKAGDIIELLNKEPDEQVRIKALYVLSRMGISEAQPVYEDFLANSDPWVRSLAVRGIGRLDGEDAARYLGIALNDANSRVVVQAVSALSRKKDDKSKELLSRKFASEENENLLVQILSSLQTQENKSSIDRAEQLLQNSSSENVIAAALKYIASVRKERAVALIDSMLISPSELIKVACAESYGLVGRENVVKRLATLFNDDAPAVRAAAFSALAMVDSSEFEFFIGQALEDQDMIPVVLAIDQIKERKLASYFPRLLALSDHVPPVEVDIRRALVDAAEGFLSENKEDSAAMRLLINGALDRDYVVRKEAAAVYSSVLGEERQDLLGRVQTRLSEGEIEDALAEYINPPQAKIVTSKGEIVIELAFDAAPLTVLNFIELAERGEYDGLIFHRIIPDFVVQGGDPRGDGWGGPGYAIRCEYSQLPYLRGTVGIATSGKDTGGSQFFITHSPQPHLEANYTIFGQVLTGMEVVDQIVRGDRIEKIIIDEEPI
ncbi:MAG: peptidylprolyl isomerase [bacterium]|nr:peptidylprolyl isomerase [bacterium]